MNADKLTLLTPTYRERLQRIQNNIVYIQEQLELLDVPEYRTAAIFDQLINQLKQAVDANDLYSSLEAEYSDTHNVWEVVA